MNDRFGTTAADRIVMRICVRSCWPEFLSRDRYETEFLMRSTSVSSAWA